MGYVVVDSVVGMVEAEVAAVQVAAAGWVEVGWGTEEVVGWPAVVAKALVCLVVVGGLAVVVEAAPGAN